MKARGDQDGDRYLTLLFIRNKPTPADPHRAVAWLPWKDSP